MKSNPKAVIAAAVLLLAGVLCPGTPSFAMDRLEAPETVTIDTLAHLYQPVQFSHKRHTQLTGCKDCHHHTTGQQDRDPNCMRCHAQSTEASKVGCKECHSKKQFYPEQLSDARSPRLYHIDKPGLKGAYHLNCVLCHEQMNGPTGCEGCHALTVKGKQFFRVNEKAAPAMTKSSHAN